MAPRASTRARARRTAIRALGRSHVLVYRASRGRVLGRLAGMPVVLLTTTGRRSGRPRTVALTTIPHGDALLLVGSFGGSDEAPAWLLNLRAHPRATVRQGGTRWEATARVASAEERERLWQVVVATHDGYARYQDRTARRIPVVLLMPGEGGTPVRDSPDGDAAATA
jgi:deazaflavin-dependent oxidoreductase (nitroreductase family)